MWLDTQREGRESVRGRNKVRVILVDVDDLIFVDRDFVIGRFVS
jgi:hypothetical protein